MTGPRDDLERLVAAAARARAGGDVGPLRALLDSWTLTEAALDRHLGRLDRSQPWSSIPVLDAPELSLDLFLMPRGASIPLHDHPGMLGLMRVLRGALSLTAYAWDGDGQDLARSLGPHRAAPGTPPPAILPEPGTVHRVTALEDAAFLDLFAPPYAREGGRPCTYYAVAERLADGRVRLEPTAI